MQLWRLTLVDPSGRPQQVSLRAPSEQIALDRAAQWRPEWTVREIRREPTAAA
jgi:hypothetical protein